MAATRLGCKGNMVGTGWANFHPGCMDGLRNPYSHLVGGSFLSGKGAWVLSGGLSSVNPDYCMLVNEWVWLRSQVCLLSVQVLGS